LENQKKDKLLNAYDLPKLNHEDINNSTRSIMSNEIEMVSQERKTHDQMEFNAEFHRPLKKK
jgi:hypothetical protein